MKHKIGKILLLLFIGTIFIVGCSTTNENESIEDLNMKKTTCSEFMKKLDSNVKDEIIGGYLIEKNSDVGGPSSSVKWIELTFKGFKKTVKITPIIEGDVINKYPEDFFIIGDFYTFNLSTIRVSGNLADSYLGPIEKINCSE